MAARNFDNGLDQGGTGDNSANDATNWVDGIKATTIDEITISAICNWDYTLDIGSNSLQTLFRFTIKTGVKLTVNVFSIVNNETVEWEGTGHIEWTTLTVVDAAGTLLSAGSTGTITTGVDIVAGNKLNFDLIGQDDANNFTIDLNGSSIILIRNGVLALQAKFQYCTIQDSDVFAIEVTEGAIDIQDTTFVNCNGALSLIKCRGQHVTVDNINIPALSVSTRQGISISSSNGIILRNIWRYGTGRGIQAHAGATVTVVGGAMGFQSDTAAGQINSRAFDVGTGASILAIGVAVNAVSAATYIVEGGIIHLIGIKTVFEAAFVTDWARHERYVESTSAGSTLKYVFNDGGTADGVAEMDQDNDTPGAPSLISPNVLGGWIRVKGGNTPSVSINVDFQSSGLNTSATLILDVGGAISGTEDSVTSSADTQTLTATLSGALPGTDDQYIEWTLKLTGNANLAVCHVSNFTVANTGVNDIDMGFGPYPGDGSWPGVLAAVGAGGVIGGPNKRGGKQ